MNRYILIALLLVPTACDLAVEVDIPFEEDLVVNSVIHPDSVWYAHVSLSGDILDSSPPTRINNAHVVMYENDLPVDTLQAIDVPRVGGFYKSNDRKPIAGKSYELKVSVGPHQLSAKTSIPVPAQIKDVKITESGVIGQLSSNYEMKVKIKFEDNAAEKNFYQVSVYSVSEEISPDLEIIHITHRGQLMYYDDVTSINNGNDYDYINNRGLLLKDILFNGLEREVTLTANYRLGAIVKVEVKTLNDDYYNYLTTQAVQETTIDDPLAQPINVYSNIQNGFGIFAGYSASTVSTEIDARPVIKSASATQASVGDIITLSVENLKTSEFGYAQVMFRSESGGLTWGTATLVSENTVQFKVPKEATTGKFALQLKTEGLFAVSDFEIEIIN